MTTSTINTTQPASGAALDSAPVRNNFAAAANDINNLYSLISGLGGTSGALVAANNLSDLASAATARTNLGLGSLALLSTTSLTANVSGILPIANGGTGASSAGPTAANNVGALAIANNLSDLASASTARTSLGLGSSAVLAAGSANGVATLDGTGKIPSSQLPSAIVNGLEFAGLWNASTNSPTLASSTGTKGTMYKVSTSGTTTLDGVSQWNAGDFALFDGTTWDKVDGLASEVLSVAGRTGAVTLTTTDISGLGTAASLAAGSANGVATLDSGGKVPAAQIPSASFTSLTYAASYTPASEIGLMTLTGNIAFAVPPAGKYTVLLQQDATGGRTASFATGFKFPGGLAPTLSTGANAIDMLVIVSSGTTAYAAMQYGFA